MQKLQKLESECYPVDVEKIKLPNIKNMTQAYWNSFRIILIWSGPMMFVMFPWAEFSSLGDVTCDFEFVAEKLCKCHPQTMSL